MFSVELPRNARRFQLAGIFIPEPSQLSNLSVEAVGFHPCLYSSVDKYLIPVSHIIVTTVASGPSSLALFNAATRLLPVDVPAKTPSTPLCPTKYELAP